MWENIACEKQNNSVPFIGFTGLNWKIKYSNVLSVSVFFKNMGWYLVVVGKLHNDECLIYIFMGGVLNGTRNIL